MFQCLHITIGNIMTNINIFLLIWIFEHLNNAKSSMYIMSIIYLYINGNS